MIRINLYGFSWWMPQLFFPVMMFILMPVLPFIALTGGLSVDY